MDTKMTGDTRDGTAGARTRAAVSGAWPRNGRAWEGELVRQDAGEVGVARWRSRRARPRSPGRCSVAGRAARHCLFDRSMLGDHCGSGVRRAGSGGEPSNAEDVAVTCAPVRLSPMPTARPIHDPAPGPRRRPCRRRHSLPHGYAAVEERDLVGDHALEVRVDVRIEVAARIGLEHGIRDAPGDPA